MERAETDFKDKILSIFFPRKPKLSNLMFHIHSDRPFQIDQRLLPKAEIRQINDALRKVSVCSSVNDLNRRFGRDEIEEVIFGRVGRFLDNYVLMQALREGGYQPAVVASGDSGIYNALVAAEVISLEAALGLVARESRLMAIARGVYGGDIFSNPEFPLHTPLIGPSLGEFKDALAEITINKPKITVVGSRGDIVQTPEEIRQEIIRQTIEPSSERAVKATLKRLGIFKPHEIGLDSAGDDNKYLTIAAAAFERKDVGVGVVTGGAFALAILGFYIHKRRQKSKKA